MQTAQQLLRLGACVSLAAAASAQVTLFDSGTIEPVIFNGTSTNLGWTSGEVGTTQPQRWTAQPFTLPAGTWELTEATVQMFIPGVDPAEIGWAIWSRNGSTAPTAADELATGSVAYSGNPADPIAISANLSGGDYYFSAYGIGATIGWFTNAPDGIEFLDGNGEPWMWRSEMYPAPGFLQYQLPAAVLDAPPGESRDHLYSAGFSLAGTNGGFCAEGTGGMTTDPTGATWPEILPPVSISSTIMLPSNASSIDSVELLDFQHTWLGDLQVVLVDPNGDQHNLIMRPGVGATGFGPSCDLVGDYSIVESGGADFPIENVGCATGVVDPGTYNQAFSADPGFAVLQGTFETPLSAIPVIPGGVYELRVFDWATGDNGTLAGWALKGQSNNIISDSYCASNAHSVGNPGVLVITGSDSLAANSASLWALLLPPDEIGYFVTSVNPGSIDLVATGQSDGVLCLGTGKGRYLNLIQTTGASGTMLGPINLNEIPQSSNPAGAYAASVGQTVYFQGWFRDGNGVNNNNFTNGASITITN